MADDEFDRGERRDAKEQRMRRALRILGIALTSVLVVCLLVVVGFYVLVFVAMDNWASNK